MLLETLKPHSLPAVCRDLATELTSLERELAQYDSVLAEDIEPCQRAALEALRGRRGRRAEMLRSRLELLNGARYHDDESVVLTRTLQVA